MKALDPGRIGILVLVTVAGLTAGLLLWQPVSVFHRQEFKVGNEMIARIESFRMSHGRLPETLKEIGIDDPDVKVYYRKISGRDYSLWFGTTLGESETYDSRTKRWE